MSLRRPVATGARTFGTHMNKETTKKKIHPKKSHKQKKSNAYRKFKSKRTRVGLELLGF
jgi:hypothetical protein